jgi:hypothetical protein
MKKHENTKKESKNMKPETRFQAGGCEGLSEMMSCCCEDQKGMPDCCSDMKKMWEQMQSTSQKSRK